MEPIRNTFKSMGTTVEVIMSPKTSPRKVAAGLATVKKIFKREERRFSRFRTDSELTYVNDRAGEWVRVSRKFMAVTRLSLEAAETTGGLFDPTVLRALKAAGYDRDYDEIKAAEKAAADAGTDVGADTELEEIRRDARHLIVKNATVCGRWREIEIDEDRLRLPAGAELDFGGIAKGWTVDRAAEKLTNVPWAIVDAGGDLRLVGDVPKKGLEVAIEDPDVKGSEALRVRMRSGALATTSVRVRTWGNGMHHVIDPRTAQPALSEILQATVWADTCAEAEVWSKAALLTGPGIFDRVSACLAFETGELVTNFSGDEEPDDDAVQDFHPAEVAG